jgi:hypothetical protein
VTGEADAAAIAEADTLTQRNIEWIRTADDVRPRGESVIVSTQAICRRF